MCAIDLDLELDLTEDETEQARAPRPAGGQAPGVAWGLAELHDDPTAIVR